MEVVKENQNTSDPTNSPIAEQSVLASIFLDSSLFPMISSILEYEDFAIEQNAYIYKAMTDLYNEDKPIDPTLVSEKLRTMGILEECGGISYLLEMRADHSKNAREYAQIVKDKSKLRNIVQTSNSLVEMVYQNQSPETVLEQAEKNIFDLSIDREGSELTHIESSLTDAFEEMEKYYGQNKKVTGLETGFVDLDMKTKGLHKSDMIVLAARPGTGKTAFALNIALNTAYKNDSSVAIFSLEMDRLQLTQRLIAQDSMVELSKLRDGSLEMEDFEKIYRSINMLAKTNIYIDDTPGISMAQIKSKCRRHKMRHGLDLVVIDFLQLIEPVNSSDPRQVQVSMISRSLKILAKEMECPVIALSQINRSSEKSKDHRPMLSDLRESGAIEQDADLVMFLYRDEMYNPDTDKLGITEVIISKHRNGETGTIELSWLGQYQKFLGLERV